ncbi:hypothetical protein EI94DRAFT_1724050 [Lactarius quietus]|nr:hypothetical protein EI94DRAFT_1724050 [Lactarius quietus]
MGDQSQGQAWHLVNRLYPQYRYIHLKELSVYFIKRRPTSVLELVFKDDAGVKHKSHKFEQGDLVYWNLDMYVEADTCATLTIKRALFKISVAEIEVEFNPNVFVGEGAVLLEDSKRRVRVNFECRKSQFLQKNLRFRGFQARTDLASKFPQLAALPPPSPTSERAYNVPYHTIHWLNDDILLDIFDCYRLDDENHWNDRLGWCNLSHVCQRWRHLIYESTFRLGMHIQCTEGTPIVDTLDHLPLLPLHVKYGYRSSFMTNRDELGLYHALRVHGRLFYVSLCLPPSILHQCFVLMDKHFSILKCLYLRVSSTADDTTTLTLPKTFVAPHLRHLALPGISPPRRLRVLTSTVTLVTLDLWDIQASSYFRPRLLVARLRSLPQLKKLSVKFSVPIPRPSTERELLGEQRTPVTLPNLNTLWFQGVCVYLECLVAQVRAPLLEQLQLTLFNQIAFDLPHLSHLINITETLKLSEAEVDFGRDEVSITTTHHDSRRSDKPFSLFVRCKQLDWQIDCAAQICSGLIPALSGVERLVLDFHYWTMPTEWENGEIDGTTWHELLRSFIGVKQLNVDHGLLEEISRALQVDEVGSHPGFLPELQQITAAGDLFASFIDTRRAVGRPVQFLQR